MLSWVSWFDDRRIIYEFGILISKTERQIRKTSGVNTNTTQENNREKNGSGVNGINNWLCNPIHTKIFEGGTVTVMILVVKGRQTFRYRIELQKGSHRIIEGNTCMEKIHHHIFQDPPKLSKSGLP
jgi:hypothetical protein